MSQEKHVDRRLDLELAEALGLKIHYHEWDTRAEIPMYIPSGKPWETHSLEGQPLPNFHRNYGSAFGLLDIFKDMAGFKLERGFAVWWWCGIEFAAGTSAKGEGETAPVAICKAVLSALDIYPLVPLASLSREKLLTVCQKRHLKGWSEHSTRQELIDLLSEPSRDARRSSA